MEDIDDEGIDDIMKQGQDYLNRLKGISIDEDSPDKEPQSPKEDIDKSKDEQGDTYILKPLEAESY